jgi:hypothetical protein
VFDPPLVLPKPGTYEFAIQGESCGEAFDLACSCSDEYPLGQLWQHGRNFECELAAPDPVPSYDLFFSVEFCSSVTPVLPRTWGAIKASYR